MNTTISSFPIEFDLRNDDDEQVLFITDDIAGQEMSLEIFNRSDKPVSPQALTEAVSAKNHHFELRFRPGTLYNNPAAVNLIELSSGPQFEMFVDRDDEGKIESNADGTSSLYFKAKDAWTIQPGEKVVLRLGQLRAEMQGGTRGTRVILKYENLQHAGNLNSFSGFREIPLNIINHRGKKNIPLHGGIVGSNRVLNDGKSGNSLRLRVTNISRKHMPIELSPTSRLILSAEGGGPDREWALATDNQLGNLRIGVLKPENRNDKKLITKDGKPENHILIDRSSDLTEVEKGLGINVWEINLWHMNFKFLEVGEFIDILIEGLITMHPIGQTNLYLHYEDIPGYWNGQFIAVVEKSPLIFGKENVGINNDQPNYTLDVNGVMRATRYYDDNTNFYVDANSTSILNEVHVSALHDRHNTSFSVTPSGDSKFNKVYASTIYDINNTSFSVTPSGDSKFNKIYASTIYDINNTSFSVTPSDSSQFKSISVIDGIFSNILYDRRNVAFYVEPSGRSKFNTIRMNPRKGSGTAIEIIFDGNPDKATDPISGIYYGLHVNNTGDRGYSIHAQQNNVHPTIYAVNTGEGHALHVQGKAYCSLTFGASDIRLKKDIQPIKNAVELVSQLRGVSFQWRTGEFPDKNFPEGETIGLIAQDVEKVFPSLVSDSLGYKGLEYGKLVAVLIEAIKEQQKQLTIQERQLQAIQQNLTR